MTCWLAEVDFPPDNFLAPANGCALMFEEGIRLMSNEHHDPSESTNLHLGKFAPGAESRPQPAAEPGLTVMMKVAAAQTVEQSGTPIVPKDGGALPGQDMLGAVSYCYAKGVYQSEEIERKMTTDPALLAAVHGEVPDARAIRKFRRLNKGAIQQTLEKAFGFLRKKQKADLMKPLPGQPAVPPTQVTLGDSTVSFVRHEAEERVQEASFIDNMSKE